MRDDMPSEIQSLIAQCEVNVSSFDNNQMSAALHWGELLFQEQQELSIDRLARELAKDGFLPTLTRCATDWYCELHNTKLGFFPAGAGLTAIEAMESAASHPRVKEIINA